MRRIIPHSIVLLSLSFASVACSRTGTSADAPPSDRAERVVAEDLFSTGQAGSFADRWQVEQQPGGTVRVVDGRLVIHDAAGCTVWWRQKLTAPVTITFEATVTSGARVSDLNCFWMASDPSRPGDLLAPGHARDGRFATYDHLRTYYVGYGGNNNTTTRFRRYDGTGARPLLPEHDRSTPAFLLVPDKTYTITLEAANGRARYLRDGEVIFDFPDPEPLTEGWFGFRTVQSRIEIRNFSVSTPGPQ